MKKIRTISAIRVDQIRQLGSRNNETRSKTRGGSRQWDGQRDKTKTIDRG